MKYKQNLLKDESYLTYDEYITKYKSKAPRSKENYDIRKRIYDDNLNEIKAHNEKFRLGQVSYELGINQFTDWTNEEYSFAIKGILSILRLPEFFLQ